MAKQSLVWTALPNGYTDDGAELRVSVLLSPRLDPEDPAGLPVKLTTFFPDWKDWPQTVAAARFDVTFNGQTVQVPATATTGPNRLDARLGLPDSTVWKALFTSQLTVKGFKYTDLSASRILSYDTVWLADRIEKLYTDLARAAGEGLPKVTDILETERWRGFISAVKEIDESSVDRHSGFRDIAKQFNDFRREYLAAGGPGPGASLARFQLFHTPPATPIRQQPVRQDDARIQGRWLEHQQSPLPEREKIAETIDFHQVVAAMGSYPTLLRKLGLVIDLVLAPGGFTPSTAAELSVNVVFPAATLTIPRTADGSPRTRTRLDGARFEAVPDPNADVPLANRLLTVASPKFAVLQCDIDGAGLKVMNFARSLRRRFAIEDRVDPVTQHEDEVGAPALRTAGVMLAHRRRADALKGRFATNKTMNGLLEGQLSGSSSSPVVLSAQDIVRGFRIDIWDSVTGRWHSLCRRHARYALGAGVIVEAQPEEESTVRLAATRSSDPASNSDVLYLHEALVSWTGWSLAARQPGRAVQRDDSVDETTDDSDAEVPPGIPFKSTFWAVKGSLPRLRFGRSYWIRARAVDLAGNSVAARSHDIADEDPLTHARPFLRYEPVVAPVIALLSAAGIVELPREGESMRRIAIRTFNDTPPLNDVTSTEIAHRVAASPQVSVRDAEQHGMLDAEGAVNASIFHLLAHLKDVHPRDPGAAIREETFKLQGPLETEGADTTFAVYETGRDLTYLPDPLAVEVAVRFFDHPNIPAGDIIRIPLYRNRQWPDAAPFLIEVYDDQAERPYYDATTHVLRVPLPKAVQATMRLSMTLSEESLSLLGIFQWLPPAVQSAQRERALSGQHWMLTPWTVVELVHATQRPLLAPDITTAWVDRASGQTSAQPVLQVRCSVDSTDRLDVHGEWHEPEDDAAADGPSNRVRRDVAFAVKITGPQHYARTAPAGGTPPWPEHTIDSADRIWINRASEHRLVFKAHEFHDTRYRRITYWLEATTRFREYLPAHLLLKTDGDSRKPTSEHITTTGTGQVTWVPNAAPPPAPKVLYVVPTFGWERHVDELGEFSSRRRGGGLRVYLDRGWNASGYGEMLAVVLPPRDFSGNPDEAPAGAPYKKYVTLWGNDPAWDSPFVPGIAPTLAHFPRARTAPDATGSWLPAGAPPEERDQKPGAFTIAGLRPPNLPIRQTRVDVAPHDVFFDDTRRLWYCDIEITTGAAYFPFVRLALARYQPISVPDAHLSPVVLSDIIAVAPDRWLTLTASSDRQTLRVSVFGASFDDSSGHKEAVAVSPRPVIEVWLERLDPRWGEDFGWERFNTAVAEVTPSLPQLTMPEGVALAGGSVRLWPALWNGDVALPNDDGSRYRLVIAEYEEYIVDDDGPYDQTPLQKERRLVFLEHVELS